MLVTIGTWNFLLKLMIPEVYLPTFKVNLLQLETIISFGLSATQPLEVLIVTQNGPLGITGSSRLIKTLFWCRSLVVDQLLKENSICSIQNKEQIWLVHLVSYLLFRLQLPTVKIQGPWSWKCIRPHLYLFSHTHTNSTTLKQLLRIIINTLLRQENCLTYSMAHPWMPGHIKRTLVN